MKTYECKCRVSSENLTHNSSNDQLFIFVNSVFKGSNSFKLFPVKLSLHYRQKINMQIPVLILFQSILSRRFRI